MSDILLIGSATDHVEALRQGLDADLVEVPTPDADPNSTVNAEAWPLSETLDAWRRNATAGPVHRQIVVAPWPEVMPGAVNLVDLADHDWFARH